MSHAMLESDIFALRKARVPDARFRVKSAITTPNHALIFKFHPVHQPPVPSIQHQRLPQLRLVENRCHIKLEETPYTPSSLNDLSFTPLVDTPRNSVSHKRPKNYGEHTPFSYGSGSTSTENLFSDLVNTNMRSPSQRSLFSDPNTASPSLRELGFKAFKESEIKLPKCLPVTESKTRVWGRDDGWLPPSILSKVTEGSATPTPRPLKSIDRPISFDCAVAASNLSNPSPTKSILKKPKYMAVIHHRTLSTFNIHRLAAKNPSVKRVRFLV